MWRDIFSPKDRAFVGGDGCALCEAAPPSPSAVHPELQGLCVYEPPQLADGYDYPLVCYLHDDQRSERDVERWFPRISDQNFLAAGIRAPFPHPHGLPGQFLWKDHRADAAQAVLRAALETLCGEWNIHPERVTLFGEGRGALVSLQQFLIAQSDIESPLPLQGVVCRDLPACWPRLLPPIPENLQGRLLLLDSIRTGDGMAALDGLSEAGLRVTLQRVSAAEAASTINYWLLSPISSVVY